MVDKVVRGGRIHAPPMRGAGGLFFKKMSKKICAGVRVGYSLSRCDTRAVDSKIKFVIECICVGHWTQVSRVCKILQYETEEFDPGSD